MEGPRRSSSGSVICDLHPQDEAFSGSFCPSCLRDRLAGLDASASASASPSSVSGRRSTSSLRLGSSLFCQQPLDAHANANANADLRRCKSFSHNSNWNRNRPRMEISTRLPAEAEAERPPNPNPKLHPSSHSNFFVRKWQQWRRKHQQSHLSTPQPQPHPHPHPHRFSFDQPQFRPRHPSSDACSSASSRRPLFHLPPQLQDDSASAIPGSQAQTRDYYLHSSTSSRRRRSFSFDRRTAKPPPQLPLQTPFNSKVSPTGPPAQFFHHHHPDTSNSKKKWNLRGLFQRSKGTANLDQSAFNANYTYSYSYNQPDHLLRCNSNCSLTARSPFTSTSYINAAESMRRNSVDNIIDFNVHREKRRDAFVLERNRSARFSPARLDNSMLHFYFTPITGSQSSMSTTGVTSQSFSARPHRFYSSSSSFMP